MTQKKGVLKRKVVEGPKSKTKKDYEYKSLNDPVREAALIAAEAHIYKLNKEGKSDESIILQLSTLAPTAKTKEYTRRMIVLPNRLRTVKNTSILLVTKDPVDTYRITLNDKDAVTTDTFADIVGYKKFKTKVGTSKAALKTYHEYDMIITDNRLHTLLPKLLQPTIFCKGSQKFPLMLQMATQSADAQLVRSKKTGNWKDERVEPEYVLSQVKSWCRNTTFVPSTGPSMSIVVGYPNMSGVQIVENIDAVISFLTQREFRPIGGLVHEGLKGIVDLHLHANDKTLPVMKQGESL
jgi:ribosome biogenesis protein UTP30